MAITLKEAEGLADSIIAKAEQEGLRVGVAVVNYRAGTILMLGMDGTRPITPDTARGKALASVIWGQSGERLADRVGNSVYEYASELYGNRFVYAKGSALLVRNGETEGAIGVSGAAPDRDEGLAHEAAAEYAAAGC